MTTYNPFHHLLNLRFDNYEGDPVLRLILAELIKQNNLSFTGTYANVLEITNFPARLLLVMYDEFFPDGMNEDWNKQSAVSDVCGLLLSHIRAHVTVDDQTVVDQWVPDLSMADQEEIIKSIPGIWTDDEKTDLLRPWHLQKPSTRNVISRPVQALASHFTVMPFGTTLIEMVEGGRNKIPERTRIIARETGAYHMTWESCQEWGFKLPKNSGFPDTTDVVANVTFNAPPKDIALIVTSSIDDVPDPENPGQMKSEQIKLKMEIGEQEMSRSLLSRDIKYHDWVFTVEDNRKSEDA